MTRPIRGPRAAFAALGALATLAAGLSAGGPAAAAPVSMPNGAVATYNTVTRIGTDGLGFQWDNGRDAGRVATFKSAHSSLGRTGVNGVLADTAGNTPARPLCHPTGIAGGQGFCWSAEDDDTDAWFPQGLAGSGESPQAQALVNGRKVLISSWHASGDKAERITFADVTDPAHISYRHALLVGLSDDSKNFAALGGHANNVVWAGSRLYVAAIGSGFDVFDLNEIWKMDATTDTSVGVDAAGRTHGGGFDYVLPRTGSYAYTGAGSGCGTYEGAGVPQRPCLTAATLDLSGPEPALVTAEGDPYSVEGKFGRATAPIVRWPVDPATGRLKADASGHVQASDAFASPMGGTQGVAMNNGRFALAAACPEFVDGGADIPSCLYEARLGEPVRLATRTGVSLENLSYWPGSDELWMVNEARKERMVVRMPWPDAPAPAGMAHLTAADLTGDGKADLAGVETATGSLWLYPGTGHGTFGDRVRIGTGWGGLGKLAAGDFTGDGKADLLAVDSDTGNLYLYPGTGAARGMSTLGDRVRIGTGWNTMRELTAMDVDKDGKPDLVAVDKDGTLWAYPGTGRGTLGDRVRIGTGWDSMTELTSPGDLNADGVADLVAVDRDGKLWAYPGSGTLDGTDTLGSRTQLGTGWDTMRQLTGADFNGDGKGDVDAVQAPAGATGGLYFYPGTGGNALGDRSRIGTGW
ncbi:FG-GAP repeat domain-containing protein [Streptomyces sp. NPDC001407]|uniref:FG-GAP repeat domain-containing protein n=1 Tax=Streptomyces sp. NPDC001407 TaxID=3364573 RepID=UPI003699C1BF